MNTRQPAAKRWLTPSVRTCLVLVALAGCARETSDEAIARGQAALRGGDYARAVRHLKRAAKLNPEHEIIMYNLGMAHLLAKNYKAAEHAFETADQLNKDNDTDALEGLAQARRLAGDHEGAIRAITRAFDRVNRKAHLVAALAVCEMEQGNNESARQLLLEALATDNTNPVALYNMGVLMQKPHFDDPTQAAEMYVRFISRSNSEKHPDEHARAIAAIKTIGDNRTDVLQMKIDDLLVKTRMARNPGEALSHAVEAVKLDQSNPDAFWTLIKTLRTIGRTAQAETMQKTFMAVFPDDPRVANLKHPPQNH